MLTITSTAVIKIENNLVVVKMFQIKRLQNTGIQFEKIMND